MPCHIRRIGFATPVIRLDVRGTCSVNRIRRDKRKVRRARRRARIGAADRTVTGLAGVVAVDELIDRFGVVAALDAGIGPIKVRQRGPSGGQLLAGMATGQLAGADCLAGLDRLRGDAGRGVAEHGAGSVEPYRGPARGRVRRGPAGRY